MKQERSSAKTSINQIASTFKKIELPSGVNLDFGGGRFDKGTLFLKDKGVSNFIFDPFNRSEVHNLLVRSEMYFNGGADSATVNNVLNVIDNDHSVLDAVSAVASGVKKDSNVYFLIHEGNKSGEATPTSCGWQRNARSESYRVFLEPFFGEVSRKGNLFTCSQPISSHKMFTREEIKEEALRLAAKNGVPLPLKKNGVGKSIGGCLYLHKSCLTNESLRLRFMDQLSLQSKLPVDFEWDVLKIDEKTNAATFISSPGFLFEDEPEVHDAIKIDLVTGSLKVTPQKNDPQIYHHKWSFMYDDGSDDWLRSLIRSVVWSANKEIDKSRIGTNSYWQEMVVAPILEKDIQSYPNVFKTSKSQLKAAL